jgi:hypothetical protein
MVLIWLQAGVSHSAWSAYEAVLYTGTPALKIGVAACVELRITTICQLNLFQMGCYETVTIFLIY